MLPSALPLPLAHPRSCAHVPVQGQQQVVRMDGLFASAHPSRPLGESSLVGVEKIPRPSLHGKPLERVPEADSLTTAQTLSPTQSLTAQGHKLLRPSLCKEHAPRARSAELLSTFEPATCGPYVARNQVQIVELKKSRGEARGGAEKQGRTLRRTGVSRSAARRCAALLNRARRECFASPVLSP